MKKFVKNCKNSSYTKLVKQIIERVTETCHVIEKRRRKATFALSDIVAVVNIYYIIFLLIRNILLCNI